MAGTFIAKSIVDNKLIDLPISNLMWDLLLGKVSRHFLTNTTFTPSINFNINLTLLLFITLEIKLV